MANINALLTVTAAVASTEGFAPKVLRLIQISKLVFRALYPDLIQDHQVRNEVSTSVAIREETYTFYLIVLLYMTHSRDRSRGARWIWTNPLNRDIISIVTE